MRYVWAGLAVIGGLVAVGGMVWLFLALGTEEGDRIASGIGAGAAVVGLILAAVGLRKARADGGAGPSVSGSTIGGSNVQVGGSVHGPVVATWHEGDRQ
jgi:hypothetical protein